MSEYLEIPQWQDTFFFRAFFDDGKTSVFPHWHREIEFIIGIKGTTKIGLGEKIMALEKNEIVFFASGEPHYFLVSPESKRMVFQIGLSVFNGEMLGISSFELSQIFEERLRISKEWPQETEEEVLSLLESLYHAQLKNDRLKTMGLLYLLIATIKEKVPLLKEKNDRKNYAKSNYKKIIQILDRVYDYVEDHYEKKITLKDVADEVGFNEQYFSRFFKENTGTTFIQFLNHYRIMKASFYLTQTNDDMGEIAEKSGFATTKNFQTTFKKMIGIAPSKYKKQALKTKPTSEINPE